MAVTRCTKHLKASLILSQRKKKLSHCCTYKTQNLNHLKVRKPARIDSPYIPSRNLEQTLLQRQPPSRLKWRIWKRKMNSSVSSKKRNMRLQRQEKARTKKFWMKTGRLGKGNCKSILYNTSAWSRIRSK